MITAKLKSLCTRWTYRAQVLHTAIHTDRHTFILHSAYIHTYIHTYIRTYVHTYIRTYVLTCVCVCICVYIYIYDMPTYIYMHRDREMYTLIHARICADSRPGRICRGLGRSELRRRLQQRPRGAGRCPADPSNEARAHAIHARTCDYRGPKDHIKIRIVLVSPLIILGLGTRTFVSPYSPNGQLIKAPGTFHTRVFQSFPKRSSFYEPGPPNYPVIDPNYHQMCTIRPLSDAHRVV